MQFGLANFANSSFPTTSQSTAFLGKLSPAQTSAHHPLHASWGSLNGILACAGQALPMLDATPYVIRYAWFAVPPFRTLGLITSNGSLTAIGSAYKAYALPCEPLPEHAPLQ
jgi:hypothetical protein